MTYAETNDDYFKWLCDLIDGNNYPKELSYKKLLIYLHNTDFRYSILKDENRAEDGIDLRYRYAHEYLGVRDAERYLKGPCSVLEMLVALSLRCEEETMDDPRIGNRTSQWFWGMITNLGLGSMTDSRFDKWFVEEKIERFLDRDYEPDGKGGLFTIENCVRDLRTVEIWHQLCWYLDGIT